MGTSRLSRKRLLALIRCLESMRKRPGMYVRKIDVETVFTFLTGFRLAAHYALGVDSQVGYELLRRMEETIIVARGWKQRAIHWSRQMEEAGMSTKGMVDELFAVEIAIWHRIAEHNVIATDKG